MRRIVWSLSILTAVGAGLAGSGCSEPRPFVGGSDGGGGESLCTTCHGTAGRVGTLPGTDVNLDSSPPAAPSGEPAAVVGAHQAHLNPATGSLRGPLACSECHVVPTDFAHASNPPAQIVVFGPLATGPVVPTDGTNPGTPTWHSTDKVTNTTCSNVYCHGSFSWTGNGQGGSNVTGNLTNAPDWTLGSGQAACGTCHALPPTNHIQSPHIVANDPTTCNGCHPGTVAPDGSIIVNAQTGASLHVNGQIDEGAHAAYPNWLTASGGDHTAAALNQTPPFATCLTCHGGTTDPFGAADPNDVPGSSCNACHNAALATNPSTEGKSWQTNCAFCHGDNTKLLTYAVADQTNDPWIIAPPLGVQGETSTSALPVGAHQKHVNPSTNTLSNPFLCSECHTASLPSDISQADHLTADGSVTVLLQGAIATTGGVQGSFTSPSCSATYCHGNYPQGGKNATPAWTTVDGSFAACSSCHGAPPATGTGTGNTLPVRDCVLDAPSCHDFHIAIGRNCSNCHQGIATGSSSTPPAVVLTGGLPPPQHVNGARDVVFGGTFGGNPVTGTWTPAPVAGNAAGGSCNVSCHAGSRNW